MHERTAPSGDSHLPPGSGLLEDMALGRKHYEKPSGGQPVLCDGKEVELTLLRELETARRDFYRWWPDIDLPAPKKHKALEEVDLACKREKWVLEKLDALRAAQKGGSHE